METRTRRSFSRLANGLGTEQDAQNEQQQQQQQPNEHSYKQDIRSPVQEAQKASLRAPMRHRSARSKDTQAAIKSTLKDFNNLPLHLQDNEYIRGGYRGMLSVGDALRSVWRLHTETGNVWSHLLGFMLFIWLTHLVVVTPPAPLAFSKRQIEHLWHTVKEDIQHLHLPGFSHHHPHNATALSKPTPRISSPGSTHMGDGDLGVDLDHAVHEPTNLHGMRAGLGSGVQACLASAHSMHDTMQHHVHYLASHLEDALSGVFSYPTPRWPVYVFCAGAMTCLLFSSICHLLGCCQEHITQRLWRLDYTGIAVLIVTSFYPPVYYGFMCSPIWRTFYLTIVTIMGTGTILVALLDEFQKPAWRAFRASMFAGLGLFGAVPILHGCLMHADVWHIRVATVGDLVMGITYLTGAAIYAQRVPERWYPGRFDLWLSSHQLFHIAVVIAAYVHWRVVLVLLEWRDASGGCALPITNGPLHTVLDGMKELGHELLHIDAVWSQLCLHAVSHLGLAPTGAAEP